MFRIDYKKFYNLLGKKNINVKNTQTTENFWKEIYGKVRCIPIPEKEVATALKIILNLKETK